MVLQKKLVISSELFIRNKCDDFIKVLKEIS